MEKKEDIIKKFNRDNKNQDVLLLGILLDIRDSLSIIAAAVGKEQVKKIDIEK